MRFSLEVFWLNSIPSSIGYAIQGKSSGIGYAIQGKSETKGNNSVC